MAGADRHETAELATVRDWLRYAVTRFTRAQIVYGHGTATALEEAAFLILTALDLPIDTLEPWLECRLTQSERDHLRDVIEKRIATRIPAAYLLNQAWIQGRRFYVDERVIVPRSYLGELLCADGLAAAVGDVEGIGRVLDLCTGSGCLAILAAEAFPAAHVWGADISPDALTVAARNVEDYRLAERVTLVKSDLFSQLAGLQFDLILSNPPYVTRAAVEAFPPEYAAEPRLAHLGGDDGLDVVRRILDEAETFLSPDGVLVVETGEAREALEAARPDLPFLWLETETSEAEVFTLTAKELRAAAGTGKPKRAPGRA